jgi:ribosome-binding protein aMBF1 (putative translation factor)
MADNLKTHGQLVAEEMNSDADFRKEWEETVLARVVAAELIRYRAENGGISQRALAELLEMKQPQVARLEMGEKNPQLDTLIKISAKLGIEFMIDITPTTRKPKLVTKTVVEKHSRQERDGASVVYAAAV